LDESKRILQFHAKLLGTRDCFVVVIGPTFENVGSARKSMRDKRLESFGMLKNDLSWFR
jgi:hypothetical protein